MLNAGYFDFFSVATETESGSTQRELEEGRGNGQLRQQVHVTWPPLSHTYQAVSSGPVCSGNEMAVQIQCLPIRSWEQKSNKGVGTEGEEGGVQ